MSAGLGSMPAMARVPAPWTPLQVVAGRISCWGRDVSFDGPLPAAIRSAGSELLTAPIQLRVAGGGDLSWDVGDFLVDPRRVSFESAAAGPVGPVTATTAVDYDGFVDVTLTLPAGRLGPAFLEIPIRACHGPFFHHINETHYTEQNSFALPDRDGELWSGRFQCGVWLGDDEVGLHWCSDSAAPMRLVDPSRTITLHRAGDTTCLRVHLCDHETVLMEPLRWRFGLMATPTRPMPERWRDQRMAPGESANVHITWWPDWAPSHADLVASDPAALRARVRSLRQRGQYLLPYVALLILSATSAAYRSGGDQWRIEPHFTLKDEGTPYWLVCPNTPWREHFPQAIAQLVAQCELSGLYYDFDFPFPCYAQGHGCGFTDASGVPQPSFNVFALREMVRTTYEQVKALQPDSLVMAHCSDKIMHGVVGFADMMLVGEEKRGPLRAHGGHYVDVLAPDELRIEYRGHQVGLTPVLLPEFALPDGRTDPELAGDPSFTRELLGLALAHDVTVWPHYCHAATVERVRVAQRGFGIADADFYGYWQRECTIRADDPALLVSSWGRPGRRLVVVTNPTGVQRPAVLHAAGVTAAVDILDGGDVKISGATVELQVPARDFRMLDVALSLHA